MASNIADINRTLERIEENLSYLDDIREELARANRLKRYELNKQYPRDPNIDIAYFGGIDKVP